MPFFLTNYRERLLEDLSYQLSENNIISRCTGILLDNILQLIVDQMKDVFSV